VKVPACRPRCCGPSPWWRRCSAARVGTLKVRLANGTPVVEMPLTVLETVEESGIFGRAWDAIRLWIR
jgi:hypothetical protein